MSRPLTGAAKTAQTRRVLLDEARAAIAERPRNPHTVVTLLERADALTPRKAPEPVTVVRYTGHGLSHGTHRPDVRVLPIVGDQAGWQ